MTTAAFQINQKIKAQDGCDICGKPARPPFYHREDSRAGDRITWELCATCESKRIAEAKEERALVDALRPQLETVLAGWHQMDRHEAYEALQRLSLEVMTA